MVPWEYTLRGTWSTVGVGKGVDNLGIFPLGRDSWLEISARMGGEGKSLLSRSVTLHLYLRLTLVAYCDSVVLWRGPWLCIYSKHPMCFRCTWSLDHTLKNTASIQIYLVFIDMHNVLTIHFLWAYSMSGTALGVLTSMCASPLLAYPWASLFPSLQTRIRWGSWMVGSHLS